MHFPHLFVCLSRGASSWGFSGYHEVQLRYSADRNGDMVGVSSGYNEIDQPSTVSCIRIRIRTYIYIHTYTYM